LNNTIFSITENNIKSGKGHYTRQMELKKYLSKKNIDLKIITNNYEDVIKKKQKTNQSLILIDVPIHSQLKINLDTLNFANKICFDWAAPQLPEINIVVAHWADKTFGFTKRYYSGLEYLITSEELPYLQTANKKYCLVSIGGHTDDLIIDQVEKLLKITYSKDVFLVNSGCLISLESRKILRKNFPRKDYLQMMAEAELIVTNGGTTLAESIILQKNIIVVPKNVYEFNFAQQLALQYSFLDVWKFNNTYKQIALLNKKWHRLDGLGLKRVGQIIEQELNANG